jgi:hypothetical protein
MWRRHRHRDGRDGTQVPSLQPLDLRIIAFLAHGEADRHGTIRPRDLDSVSIALVGGRTCTFAALDEALARLETDRLIRLEEDGRASLTDDGRRALERA